MEPIIVSPQKGVWHRPPCPFDIDEAVFIGCPAFGMAPYTDLHLLLGPTTAKELFDELHRYLEEVQECKERKAEARADALEAEMKQIEARHAELVNELSKAGRLAPSPTAFLGEELP